MSDPEENTEPFRLPEPPGGETRETFRERLRRKRREIGSSETGAAARTWQSRIQKLVAFVVESPHDSASIARKEAAGARSVPGVRAVLFAEDLPPFQNSLGREQSSEPLLAEEAVHYRGQPVALVVGETEEACREAATLLDIEYHAETGVLSLEEALALDSFHGESRSVSRGDASGELSKSTNRFSGVLTLAPQWFSPPRAGEVEVRPMRDGSALAVETSSLLPTLVRSAVANAAELPESEVHLESAGLPGLSGGLETAAVRLAALATHAVLKTGSAVRIALAVPGSPLVTALRHETRAVFDVSHDDEGHIDAVDLRLALDGGWFEGDSTIAQDRALLHADCVYRIPHLKISSRLCRTNRLVSAGLPAEGAAQAVWAMEEIVERVAERTGLSPHQIREKNFYREDREPNNAPYGQPVHSPSIQRVWHQAMIRSDFADRVEAVKKWNGRNAAYKRGIAMLPVKFGVGDPRPERNAAAVIVQILADGSVTVRAGLVDLNDGFDRQIQEEVAARLGIEESAIHVILNDFDSLPRATAVTGNDAAGLVLRALDDACGRLLDRLREVALQLFAAKGRTEIEVESIRFARGVAGPDITPGDPLHFKEVIEGAWRKRVNLVETGYHRTPNLWWDRELGAGWPFAAYTYAVAVVEIQIDAFTGELQVLRVDAVHEGSPSAEQNDRDFAQLVRAFQIGNGWQTMDGLPAEGESRHPEHRGVQGFADAPFQIHADRLRPHGDPMLAPGDPCGEAPILLAGAIRCALRDALHSFGLDAHLDIRVPFPATPPALLAVFKEISLAVRDREESKAK